MRKLGAYPVYLTLRGVITLASELMFTTLAVYYVQTVGMSPLQLVLVGTVLECTVLVFEVPTGVVADTFSRRLSVTIGCVILGAAFVLEGAVPLVAAVLLAEGIRGIGETFLSGATDAWLADEVGEDRVGQVYLRAAQVDRVAGLVGICVSVAAASVQLNLPLLIGGRLYLALSVFLMLCMPERGFQATPPAERSSWRAIGGTFREGVRVVRRSPVLLMLLGVSLFWGAASEGYDRLWEAHFLLNLSFPALGALKPVVWFGVISVSTQILTFIAAALFQRRLDAISQSATAMARALLVTNALIVAGVITLGLAGSFALALGAVVVIAVARSLGGPLYSAWLVRQIDPKVRATVLSIGSQANALGQTAGGPALGALGTFFSLRAALVAAGIVLSPVLALYGRSIRSRRADPAPPDAQPAHTEA